MRFATFEHGAETLSGVVVGDKIHPLAAGMSLLGLIERGPEALRHAGTAALRGGAATTVSRVRLMPPILPPTVRDFATFEEHIEGVSRGAGPVPEWYEAPTFYFSNPYAIIGAHDDVAVPPGSQQFDFELEVAAVIGRAGQDLTPEEARDHIVGYTIMNDWSARDLQAREMKASLGPIKGKDSATTLGPWLVTTDELEPYRDADGFLRLGLTAEVNRRVIGRDLLSNMAWPFEDLVAYASRGTQIRPGDVLGSGTCGNGGCLAEIWGRTGREDPPPLRPGDVVTLTVEGIGAVSNTVIAGRAPVHIGHARQRPRDRPHR